MYIHEVRRIVSGDIAFLLFIWENLDPTKIFDQLFKVAMYVGLYFMAYVRYTLWEYFGIYWARLPIVGRLGFICIFHAQFPGRYRAFLYNFFSVASFSFAFIAQTNNFFRICSSFFKRNNVIFALSILRCSAVLPVIYFISYFWSPAAIFRTQTQI